MKKVQHHFTVAATEFTLDPTEVERRLRRVTPEPIRDHFVVIGGVRYPPKQVLALLTNIDRADFTTYQSRAILRRLGFTAGRIAESVAESAPKYQTDDHWGESEAAELRPHRGRWVALKDGRVIVSTSTPQEVLRWLQSNNQTADSLFRVPVDPALDMGGFGG
ncbi:MAG: DUF5678 domain-containing protein [Actinomycetota bacterium]|nr:DUF5678 domain-containing protein [Actinomycetota bacterium]